MNIAEAESGREVGDTYSWHWCSPINSRTGSYTPENEWDYLMSADFMGRTSCVK
jgi:hypothetical protein